MKRYCSCLFGLLALLLTTLVYAEDEPGNTIVSGFGTLGGVYNSNEKYGFTRDIGQEGHSGRQYSWQNDTRLGVQVAHSFNPQWQTVGQILVRDQAEQTLNNSISRAFISYRPNTDIHLRFGRMADATFLMSDYMDVGYAYPWVRPPQDSYGIMLPHFYDGADVTYSIPDATGVWRLKGLVGRIKVAAPRAGTNYIVDANDLWGLALIREQGPLKVRIGYSTLRLKNHFPTGEIEVGLNQLIVNPQVNTLYPAIAGEARALLDEINSIEGARLGYASVSLAYDDGKWVAQAEINNLSSQTKLTPSGQLGYASLGYRIGNVLPYMTIGASRASSLVVAGSSWGAALGTAAGDLQNGALTAQNSQRISQSTLSLGMRWEFDSRAAFKLQWDHVRVRNSGWRLWTGPMGDDGAAGRVNLLSATIDFVF